jgi:exodeoxyribonuclease V alpha subunit
MSDVAVRDPGDAEAFAKALEEAVSAGYAPYLAAGEPAERFRLFGGFRVLCAVREGPFGVTGLNRLIEKILAKKGLVSPSGLHYHGRPVLVTANDYTTNLFNGDIGMVLRDDDGELRCFFPGQSVRKISVTRLPEHETAYAMTVHKSQGSEFDRVLLLLPPKDSPVLTRELVYTGVTRAMTSLELWTTPEIFSLAAGRRTERTSGLSDLLAMEQG